MQQTLGNLINHLEGIWVSNQTVYDFKNKTIHNYKFDIEVSLLNKLSHSKTHTQYMCKYKNIHNKIIYNYILQPALHQKYGTIEKIEDNEIVKYVVIFDSNRRFKISYSQQDIVYTEHLFFLHKNFKLSIGIIKKANKYKAISFTSDIKVIHK
nr:hypothetical protein [Hypnea sp.]